MKSSVFLGSVLATLLVTGIASAAKTNFKADMSTDNENDPQNVINIGNHNPTATGEFTFDDVTKELCGKIKFTDLTGAPAGIHIHQAPPGAPFDDGVAPAQGKLIIPLPAAGTDTVTFNFKLTPAFEASLLAVDPDVTARELYANIHTAANPAPGEARGSLEPGTVAVTCPAATNPDGGASTSGSTSSGGDGGSTSSTSSSSTSSSSGATSSTSSSASSGGSNGATTNKSDAGSGDEPPPEEKSGCNAAGAPLNAMSLAFVIGAAIAAVSSRLRRKKR